MYSAALLLMLVVRIYADNMEGPTGNDKRMRRNVCLWFFSGGGRIAFGSLLKLIVGGGIKVAVFYYPLGGQQLQLKGAYNF